MNKKLILLFFFFFTINIHGIDFIQDYLFVNSYPLRAKVIIDDIDKGILTPCILKNITSINKTITIKKEGYTEQVIKVSDIKTKKIDVNLTPLSISLFFPEMNLYNIGNNQIKGPLYISNLNKGNYNIDKIQNQIYFKKVSDFFPAEVGLSTAFGISTSYMFISIGLTEYYGYQSKIASHDFDQRHFDLVSRGFDISKYVSISVTSVIAVALTGILIADFTSRNYYNKQKLKIETKYPTDQGKTLYDSAIQFLSIGEIDKSSKILQSLILLYPESDNIPLSYYQLGQNYYILKDYNNALNNWDIFITNYPIAEYYDYVLKNIAEIHYQKGDLVSAISCMNKILFTENILDREIIYSFKAKLLNENYYKNTNEENLKLAENEYLSLINNFGSSENINFYFQEVIKLYKKGSNSDKLIMLKKKAEEIPDAGMRNIILSYF
ncbi:MAG: outer membrane protein assembly factor BamD [Spirochaetes bacterium]|nr:outer membrane protein assembly factor BamD [Spirochaetota bacterium]